ncbi:MAG TPA: glycosyltransferase [Edaphocola sp.]|nr:glycosyltransferase [Edaphocola sp.]
MNSYLIFSLILIIAYAILMLIYTYGFLKARRVASVSRSEVQPFLSIIIPARNESANIADCINSILNNNYPRVLFEIILVDDFSSDETASIAKEILNLEQDKVLYLKDFISEENSINAFKKKALSIGIEHSRGDYIITTDADCIVQEDWLQLLANKMLSRVENKCLGAPVNFIPANNKKNLLYYFQSLDFMTMQGITVASNILNLGNMSNGANFMFSKPTFVALNGYKDIDHLASGDDMMLMQKINNAFPGSIDFLLHTDAIVLTPTQPSWSSFFNQRVRWASKSNSYPQFKLSLILLLVYLTNLNFLMLLLLSIFQIQYLYFLAFGLLIKVVCELIFLFPVSLFFKKIKELIFFIFLQPVHIAYIISAGFLAKFGSYKWKGRTVK